MYHTRCFLYGLFFAVLQYSYFLALESGVSATMTIYMTVVFSWLAGTWVGLRLGSPVLRPYHTLLSLAAYLGTLLCVRQFPFDQRVLPFCAAGVSVSGFMVGIFFRSYARHFRQAKALFFSENNGFILGLMVALWGFLEFGKTFLVAVPLVLSTGLLLLDWAMDLRERQLFPALDRLRARSLGNER